METTQVNLNAEFAKLLSFTADVATAIRMYSAYNQSGAKSPNAPEDLMWLSDCLHNFDRLGNAILAGQPALIVDACDTLISAYQGYQQEFPGSSRQAKPTFERNASRVPLSDAIAVFTAIREKVIAVAGA